MGFLDKFKKKKEDENKGDSTSKDQPANNSTTSNKRIKKYTSDGKPVYE